MLEDSARWLFFFLYWQLLLWAVYLPIPSVALLATFVVARRIRRVRLAALAATAVGFGVLVGIVIAAVFGGQTSASPWADFAFLTGGYAITFLPIAFFTSRIAVRSGWRADSGKGTHLGEHGGSSVGPLREAPFSGRIGEPTDR